MDDNKKKVCPQNVESLRSIFYNSQFFKDAVDSFQKLAKSVAPVIEEMRRTIPYLLKAIPTLKYFVIRDSHFYISDACFLKELENRHSNTTDKNILLNFIEEFYSRNNYEEVCRLIDELDSFELIEKRLQIIKSVKSVISCGLKETDIANVVIPVIIAQIDGVIKDFHIAIDPDINSAKDAICKKFICSDKLNNIELIDYINILHTIGYLFYFDEGLKEKKKGEIFFEKATEEELENYVLNRNSIMHGEKVDYGKKIELIRVILFYDTVVKSVTNAINEINKKKLEHNEEAKIVESGE